MREEPSNLQSSNNKAEKDSTLATCSDPSVENGRKAISIKKKLEGKSD
jgi:hypothetical protein